MDKRFTAALISNNGKLELNVYTSAAGLTILGSRHERTESGKLFPDAVYEFQKPGNSSNYEIAVAALEGLQGYFDRNQNVVKKDKKK